MIGLRDLGARKVFTAMWLLGMATLTVAAVGLAIESGFVVLSPAVWLAAGLWLVFLAAGLIWRSVIPKERV